MAFVVAIIEGKARNEESLFPSLVCICICISAFFLPVSRRSVPTLDTGIKSHLEEGSLGGIRVH